MRLHKQNPIFISPAAAIPLSPSEIIDHRLGRDGKNPSLW
jgi:hypothetical protein